MLAVRAITARCLLLALILGANGEIQKRHADHTPGTPEGDQWLCINQPDLAAILNIDCSHWVRQTTSSSPPTTSSSASTLVLATWCRVKNGSTYALGYTFMNGPCTKCRCTNSHLVICSQLPCMASYCIDNSAPMRQPGQCCDTCSYETALNACTYQGMSYPYGTIIRDNNNIKCWCQSGQIECRAEASSLSDVLGLSGNAKIIYIVVVVVGFVLLGSLMCCCCALFLYYYYQRNQATIRQAYDQYCGTAGWQPMDGEGAVAEVHADYSQEKAEQYKEEPYSISDNRSEYPSPPYALYNGAYVSEIQHAQQKKA